MGAILTQAVPRLPPEARDLALRAGGAIASAFSQIELTQSGTMGDKPGGSSLHFRARQTIDLKRPAFEWTARVGPFGCVSVTDRLDRECGELDVRLFGYVPLVKAAKQRAVLKADIIRYLAELAWAPDAILQNHALSWTVIAPQVLEAKIDQGDASGKVRFFLDREGLIEGIIAEDRPRREKSNFIERPWHGHFRDYRKHCGRWLPFAAEVSWVLNGEAFVTWRGNLASWRLV